MKKRMRWQKIYIAIVMLLGLSLIFWGLIYLILVVFGSAPSMSYLISNSEVNTIFAVFLVFLISIIRASLRDVRQAYFLLPSWMKDSINQHRSETPERQKEFRKDNIYALITIISALVICILAVAFTLTD